MAIYQWGSSPCGCIDAHGVLTLPDGGSLAIDPAPAQSGQVRLSNGAAIKARNAADSGDVAALVVSANDEVRLGDPFSAAVDCAVALRANSSAGSVATSGDLRMRNAFSICARNGADNADHEMLSQDGSNNVYLGGASPIVSIRSGGANRLSILGSSIRSLVKTIEYSAAVVSPVLGHGIETRPNSVGTGFTIHAQDCTGAGSTGGDLVLRPGGGTSTDGVGRLKHEAHGDRVVWTHNAVVVGGASASATIVADANNNVALLNGTSRRVEVDATGLGFFAKAPVPQQADYGALTDNTNGTGGGTLVDVAPTGGFANGAACNNNFATLNVKLNAIRSLLRAFGLMA
jgi:hypothetical protein